VTERIKVGEGVAGRWQTVKRLAVRRIYSRAASDRDAGWAVVRKSATAQKIISEILFGGS
jgi:hypothetical protein